MQMGRASPHKFSLIFSHIPRHTFLATPPPPPPPPPSPSILPHTPSRTFASRFPPLFSTIFRYHNPTLSRSFSNETQDSIPETPMNETQDPNPETPPNVHDESESKNVELEEEEEPYRNPETGEVEGPRGPEPTRYGDWEKGGRCYDF